MSAILPNMFTSDDTLWAESDSLVSEPANPWSFSKNLFFVGSSCYQLSWTTQHNTPLELALFDLHFTFWKSKREYIDGKLEYNHSYNYHARIRSLIEQYFITNKDGTELKSPEFLTPWLWRTYTLRQHSPTGRASFLELAKRRRLQLDVGPKTNGKQLL